MDRERSMMISGYDEKFSEELSNLLRHSGPRRKVPIRIDGFARIADVKNAMRCEDSDIRKLVTQSWKRGCPRFQMGGDEFIRATRKHSISVSQRWLQTAPEVCLAEDLEFAQPERTGGSGGGGREGRGSHRRERDRGDRGDRYGGRPNDWSEGWYQDGYGQWHREGDEEREDAGELRCRTPEPVPSAGHHKPDRPPGPPPDDDDSAWRHIELPEVGTVAMAPDDYGSEGSHHLLKVSKGETIEVKPQPYNGERGLVWASRESDAREGWLPAEAFQNAASSMQQPALPPKAPPASLQCQPPPPPTTPLQPPPRQPNGPPPVPKPPPPLVPQDPPKELKPGANLLREAPSCDDAATTPGSDESPAGTKTPPTPDPNSSSPSLAKAASIVQNVWEKSRIADDKTCTDSKAAEDLAAENAELKKKLQEREEREVKLEKELEKSRKEVEELRRQIRERDEEILRLNHENLLLSDEHWINSEIHAVNGVEGLTPLQAAQAGAAPAAAGTSEEARETVQVAVAHYAAPPNASDHLNVKPGDSFRKVVRSQEYLDWAYVVRAENAELKGWVPISVLPGIVSGV